MTRLASMHMQPDACFACVRACVQAGLLGVVGLTTGLLVETLLLIIRSNRPVPLEDRMPHLFDAKVRMHMQHGLPPPRAL